MQKLWGKCINLMHLFVATRGEIFSLKFTKYRLAAGLCPEPLGELKRSRGEGEGRVGKGNWLQAIRGDRRP